MGNGDSSLRKRYNDIDDLNTVGINFLGGDGCDSLEFKPPLPADKMVVASLQGEDPFAGKDPINAFQINTVNFNASNEDNIKLVYHNIMFSLINKKKRMDKKFSGNQDELALLHGQKYEFQDALNQIKSAFNTLKLYSGIEDSEAIAQFKDYMQTDPKKPKKKPDDQSKNNDEQNIKQPVQIVKELAEDYKQPVQIVKELAEDQAMLQYKGWENFPKLCLKVLFDNPYLYDTIKCQTLRWEFSEYYQRKINFKIEYKISKYLSSFSGLIGEVIRAFQSVNQKTKRTVWLSGILGPNDFESLLDLVPKEMRYYQIQKKYLEEKKTDEDLKAKEKQRKEQELNNKNSAAQQKPQEQETKNTTENPSAEKVDEGIEVILIPGVSICFGSFEFAKSKLLDHCKSKQEGIHRVIYEITNCHPYVLEEKQQEEKEENLIKGLKDVFFGIKNLEKQKDVLFVHRLVCKVNRHYRLTNEDMIENYKNLNRAHDIVYKKRDENAPDGQKNNLIEIKKLRLSQEEIDQNNEKIQKLRQYGFDIHVFNLSNIEKHYLQTYQEWRKKRIAQIKKEDQELAKKLEAEIIQHDFKLKLKKKIDQQLGQKKADDDQAQKQNS